MALVWIGWVAMCVVAGAASEPSGSEPDGPQPVQTSADADPPIAPPPDSEVVPTDEAPPEPRARVGYSNFVALRYNPWGLVERLRLGYRHRLYESDDVLFERAWFDVGMEATLAPTYGSAGVRVEVQPLAILNLAATYEYIGYFGVLGAVMPIDSTQTDYWETTNDARDEAGDNYAAHGSRLTLAGVLQAKAGPVIVRNTLTALRVDLNLRDGAPMMYDATQDLVLPDGGWSLIDDTDVGAMIGKGVLGVRYTYADALHGTGGPGDLPTHRVGPLFAWTFHDRPPGARFDRPTLLVLVQWHAQHPWRAGERRSPAVPLAAVAFSFEGDLWTGRR